jgi:hypothetical protein
MIFGQPMIRGFAPFVSAGKNPFEIRMIQIGLSLQDLICLQFFFKNPGPFDPGYVIG